MQVHFSMHFIHKQLCSTSPGQKLDQHTYVGLSEGFEGGDVSAVSGFCAAFHVEFCFVLVNFSVG